MQPKEALLCRKEELIDKIIQQPLLFTCKEFLDLVSLRTKKEEKLYKTELNFDALRKMIIRILISKGLLPDVNKIINPN